MKKLILILLPAAALMAGCVAYPQYYGGPDGTMVQPGHVAGPYVSGGIIYSAPAYPAGPAPRDRDGDGIPNRYDRDRDGDGVPNRQDRRPANPNRY
jgi:hypothetical protein